MKKLLIFCSALVFNACGTAALAQVQSSDVKKDSSAVVSPTAPVSLLKKNQTFSERIFSNQSGENNAPTYLLSLPPFKPVMTSSFNTDILITDLKLQMDVINIQYYGYGLKVTF
jgi:hypothetical protein